MHSRVTSAGFPTSRKEEQLLELCKIANPTQNDIDKIEDLLQEHVNVNSICKRGMTPLMCVCWKNCSVGAKDLVEMLIDYGANVNVISADRWTTLHVVCRYNQSSQAVDIIRLLLRKGIDVNVANEKGTTALQLLAQYNHSSNLLTLFELLLQSKADVSARNTDDETVLHRLCRYNQSDQMDQVIKLLLKHRIDVHALTKKGFTALHMLCRYNHSPRSAEILKLIVGNQIPNPLLHVRDNNGWTALHFTCRYNQNAVLVDILKLFAQHKFDFCAKVNQGDLNINSIKKINPIFKRRLERSISLRYNSTALHFLCRYNHGDSLLEAIKIILLQINDINVLDEDGRTALHLLCRYNQSVHLFDAIRLLVDRNSDIHSKDNEGLTPVDCLPLNGTGQFHEIFKYLNKVERDLTYAEDFVIQVAKFGCTYWVNQLIEKEQVNTVDASGRSATAYLQQLKTDGFPLCPVCRATSCNILNSSKLPRKKQLANGIFTRDDQQLNFPVNIDTQFYDAKEEFPFETPSFDQWNLLSTSWHKNNCEWFNLDQYLRSNSHEQCKPNCLWCEVSKSVVGYVRSLMCKLEQVDHRFQVEHLIEYGSSAERTKIFAPDEFDFGFVLKNFVQSDDNDKVVIYTSREDVIAFHIPQNVSEHSTRYSAISSARLLYYFQKMMTFLVKQESSLQIFSPHVSYSETCVTIHFIYRGKRPPAMRISIDITLAVKMQQHFEVISKFPEICKVAKPNERRQYLVPFRKEKPSSWKASYPSMERDTVLAAGDAVRRVMKLIKLLVALEQSEPGSKVISRKLNPATYAIKTCMLTYLKENPSFRNQAWNVQEQLDHCIGVLKLFPVDGGQLLSFFNEEIVQNIDAHSRKTINNIVNKLQHLRNQIK